MSWFSCMLVFLLASLPLYSVIVMGVPFSVDFVLCFNKNSQQTWPPMLNLEGFEKYQERPNVYMNGDALGDASNAQHLVHRLSGALEVNSEDEKKGSSPEFDAQKAGAVALTDEILEPFFSPIPQSLFVPLEGKTFLVREGPHYNRTKKKLPSGPSFYDLYGADLVHIPHPSGCCINHGKHIDFSKIVGEGNSGMVDGVPRVLLSVLQFANDESGGWFGKSEEKARVGVFSFLMYFKLNQTGELAIKNKLPQIELFKKYIRGMVDETRLKTIIKIKNKESLGIPFVLRKSLEQVDGKPFLSGRAKDNKSAMYLGDCYFEHVHIAQNFGYLAKKGISSFKGRLHQIKFDYGFTVEAREDDEMPENILAALTIGPGIKYGSQARTVNWPVTQSVLNNS
eukprot:CAMPEP_0184490054 /NCGR_PEP_ID=MMETSP0113_2-20130426/17029_1 /TAXON_ID=91329 /ORGANISM="Norrisiella sphaerica, Strain BC52" /LENGTH=395 /DNA_ID=CAMNT_0026873793 /DNA_START=231 /DNA_END=1418 /DNA_ORIENTATION=+